MTNGNTIIGKAKSFAWEAHENQVRKYTGELYYYHLHEVASLCEQYGCDEMTIAAAYLHDVIEDQPVTADDLRREFGTTITEIVIALTDMPVTPGINREQRKLVDIERLRNADTRAQTIKCADLISNTSSIVERDPKFARTYLPEKREILKVLTRANSALFALALKRLNEAEKIISSQA